MGAVTVQAGQKLAAPAAPKRTNYNFAGWYRDAAYRTVWDFSKNTVTGNITLYAKWVAQPKESTLKAIKLSAGKLSPSFAAKGTSYTVKLKETDASVTITPVKTRDGATMTINGEKVASLKVSLANGKSKTVTVKVTWNQKTTTYHLTVKRPKSSVNTLSTLKPSAGKLSPAFAEERAAYTVTLDAKTKSVKLTVKAASALARVTMNGAEKTALTVKPAKGESVKVKVKVVSQAGESRTYTVTVWRKG